MVRTISKIERAAVARMEGAQMSGEGALFGKLDRDLIRGLIYWLLALNLLSVLLVGVFFLKQYAVHAYYCSSMVWCGAYAVHIAGKGFDLMNWLALALPAYFMVKAGQRYVESPGFRYAYFTIAILVAVRLVYRFFWIPIMSRRDVQKDGRETDSPLK
jgi:hypothetical protein